MKHLVIFLFLFIFSSNVKAQINVQDSLILVEFYNINKNKTFNWDLSSPSTWTGVTFKNNRVYRLNLRNKGIDTLNQSFYNLSELDEIQFQANNIKTLSSDIENLKKLKKVYLTNNKIFELPEELGNSNILYLEIERNQLYSIPSEISSLISLNNIFLKSNNLGYSAFENIDFAKLRSYNEQNLISHDSSIIYENSIVIYAPDSATNNTYQWYNSNGLIDGETNRSISVNSTDIFYCIIQNPDYPDLPQVQTGNYSLINAEPFWEDSLALIDIFNSNPSNNLNWSATTMVKDWNGVTHSGFIGDRVTALNLENENLDSIPNSIQNLNALDTLILSNNNFVFDDLYATLGMMPSLLYIYSPQEKLGSEVSFGFVPGDTIILEVDASVTNYSGENSFQWYKNNIAIQNATNRTYTASQIGTYHCEINNNNFSELTLYQNNIFLFDLNAFNQDSLIVRSIYLDNPNNTLSWDINNTSISSWEGVTMRGGRVQSLHLMNTNIQNIPLDIDDLSELDTLVISYNDLNSIPNSIGNFNHLVKLSLENTNIHNINDSIFNNTSLEVLNLSNNFIAILNDSISKLLNLDTINISSNNITFDDLYKLPDSIDKIFYAPQNIIGNEQLVETAGVISISIEDNIDPNIVNNQYQWFYNGENLVGENGRTIIVYNSYGIYDCIISNDSFPELTLNVAPITVTLGPTSVMDSLILVDIIDLNNENTLNWQKNRPIGEWDGVLVNGSNSRVQSLDIWGKNIEILPINFGDLIALNKINLGNNKLVDIPLSITNLNQNVNYINLSQNHLSFKELDVIRNHFNMDSVNFVYSNQKLIGEQNLIVDLEGNIQAISIPQEIISDNDFYQWYFNDSPLFNENNDTLYVSEQGNYFYTITNTNYFETVLSSYSIEVTGVNSINFNERITFTPNPITSYGKIELSPVIKLDNMILYDLHGKQIDVLINKVNMFTYNLNFSNVPNGLYILVITSNDNIFKLKLIKNQ